MNIDIFVVMSLNSIIAKNNHSGSRIFKEFSSRKLLKFREKIRNKYDAILIGANTLIEDNPNLLNSKLNNQRLVIDEYYNLPLDSKIFINKSENTTIILKKDKKHIHYFDEIKQTGANILFLDNLYDFKKNKKEFREIGINNILLEGGAKIITKFLKNNAVNNIQLIVFPFFLNNQGVNLFLRQDYFGNFNLMLCKIIDHKYIFMKFKL